jgi:hypothetical protein
MPLSICPARRQSPAGERSFGDTWLGRGIDDKRFRVEHLFDQVPVISFLQGCLPLSFQDDQPIEAETFSQSPW